MASDGDKALAVLLMLGVFIGGIAIVLNLPQLFFGYDILGLGFKSISGWVSGFYIILCRIVGLVMCIVSVIGIIGVIKN